MNVLASDPKMGGGTPDVTPPPHFQHIHAFDPVI